MQNRIGHDELFHRNKCLIRELNSRIIEKPMNFIIGFFIFSKEKADFIALLLLAQKLHL